METENSGADRKATSHNHTNEDPCINQQVPSSPPSSSTLQHYENRKEHEKQTGQQANQNIIHQPRPRPYSHPRPRDAPSVTFTVDPHLNNIYNREQFGVVLVAAWPPNQSLTGPYERFIRQVKQCFDSVDLDLNSVVNEDHDGDGGEKTLQQKQQQHSPNVYLYPAQHLHITVATFHPFNHSFAFSNNGSSDNDSDSCDRDRDHDSYVKICQKIVRNAMQRAEWPKDPFRVQIDGAQIGEKAGVLLWNDSYNDDDDDDDDGPQGQGSFHIIRNLVKEEYDKAVADYNASSVGENEENNYYMPKGKELIIPKIIHSTFLRFGGKPHTDGQLIQNRFQSLVMKDKLLNEIFQDGIVVESIKMVVEKRAYMHIPCDEHHVFESCDL